MKPSYKIRLFCLSALLCCYFSLSGGALANHVKCSCPSVNARATGSTSCSASESDGQCTVAFNEFDQQLEIAAVKLLQLSSRWDNIEYHNFPAEVGSSSKLGFTQTLARRLAQQGPNAVVDQIMIYALVTLVQSRQFQNKQAEIRDVHSALRRDATAISNAFANGTGVYQNNLITVGHGCFELRANGLWGMYKASWSSFIERNQC